MPLLHTLAAATLLGATPHAPAPALPQAPAALIGRWDLVIDAPGRHKAGWLEVRKSGSSTLVGAFVAMVGSSRPVSKIDFKDGEFRFTIPPQWNDAEGDNTVVGRLRGDSIFGTISYAKGTALSWRGARAPTLRRAAVPVWGTPINLLNGRDLAGWKTLGEGESQWEMAGGILRNRKAGTDLVTERAFTDFKLHVEFRYPKGSNSGIYLRGRYEVQIEDTPPGEPRIDGIGSVYGHIMPNEHAARAPGEWQAYDITLVGRRLTVVLNGRTIISQQEIPGITGGALDSDEGAPGPIFLQGDHGPVEFRNIVITPAR